MGNAMKLVGRKLYIYRSESLALGLEKLILPPETVGLSNERGKHIALFNITNEAGARGYERLGPPMVDGFDYSLDWILRDNMVWLTMDEFYSLEDQFDVPLEKLGKGLGRKVQLHWGDNLVVGLEKVCGNPFYLRLSSDDRFFGNLYNVYQDEDKLVERSIGRPEKSLCGLSIGAIWQDTAAWLTADELKRLGAEADVEVEMTSESPAEADVEPAPIAMTA